MTFEPCKGGIMVAQGIALGLEKRDIFLRHTIIYYSEQITSLCRNVLLLPGAEPFDACMDNASTMMVRASKN